MGLQLSEVPPNDGQSDGHFFFAGQGECRSEGSTHVYFDATGYAGCERLCAANGLCLGFSVSSYGNCLNWYGDANAPLTGGKEWGGASCMRRVNDAPPARPMARCEYDSV